MTAKNLRELWHAVPFRPFRVHLPGDQKIRVPHPDFMAMAGSGRTATIYGPKDEIYTIDVFLITALEVEPPRTRRTSKS